MITKLLDTFRTPPTPLDKKEEKKKAVKELLSKTKINWCDIENLLFWKDPRVSLAVFVIATALFWKFITYKLQKLGLVLIAFTLPCSFPETRVYIWRFLCGTLSLQLDPSRRNLGFDCNDIYNVVADCWLKVEQHLEYLKSLRKTSSLKFCLFLSSYITMVVITITYLPLAEIFYVTATVLYFYPILMYINVLNIFTRRLRNKLHPLILHWSHSQTKRHRNRDRMKHRHKADSDIENEEFIPLPNKECQKVLDEEIARHVSTSDQEDEMDEFQLRGEFLRKNEGHSSDYDEDSFLPSYDHAANEMPSLSQFDSILEPLDEFHAGLDFRNVTTASGSFNFSRSNFGLPSDHEDNEETSDDIDDIPLEDDANGEKSADEKLFTSSAENRLEKESSAEDMDDFEFDVDQEFEFLDRTELADFTTDEETLEHDA